MKIIHSFTAITLSLLVISCTQNRVTNAPQSTDDENTLTEVNDVVVDKRALILVRENVKEKSLFKEKKFKLNKITKEYVEITDIELSKTLKVNFGRSRKGTKFRENIYIEAFYINEQEALLVIREYRK